MGGKYTTQSFLMVFCAEVELTIIIKFWPFGKYLLSLTASISLRWHDICEFSPMASLVLTKGVVDLPQGCQITVNIHYAYSRSPQC